MTTRIYAGALMMVGALAIAATPSLAQKSKKGGSAGMHGAMLSSGDRKFVTEAAGGGLAEVKLGELASQKASSAGVKEFGERMVKDHSAANQELEQVASGKGITLPKDMDAKHKATYNRLSKLSGAAFDKAYMTDMVSDHKHDVAAFQHEASGGKDADVKGFASKTLPTLKEHLQMAEKVAASTKGGPSAHRGKK